MPSKSSTAVFTALAVQRRRLQQGYPNHRPGRGMPDVLAEPPTALPDVGELTVRLVGPDGANLDPQD